MSSPERNPAGRNRWDRNLSHRLQHWVDDQPSPEGARQRLLQAAAEKQPSPGGDRDENAWPRVVYRKVARFLPRREHVPFPIEEFVHSVTISSPLVPGVIFCS